MKQASPERKKPATKAVVDRNTSLIPFPPTSYVFDLSFSLSLSCFSFHSCSALSLSSFSFFALFSSRLCFARSPDEIVAARSFALPPTPTFACKMVNISLVDVWFAWIIRTSNCSASPVLWLHRLGSVMLDIARAIPFIWLGPYRGKMMRAGNFRSWCSEEGAGPSNGCPISRIASPARAGSCKCVCLSASGKYSSQPQPLLTFSAWGINCRVLFDQANLGQCWLISTKSWS